MEEIARISIMLAGIANYVPTKPYKTYKIWSECNILDDIRRFLKPDLSPNTIFVDRMDWYDLCEMMKKEPSIQELIKNCENEK